MTDLHRIALEGIDVGIIIADADGQLLFVNKAASKIHGVDTTGITIDQYSDTYHLLTEAGEPYPPHDLPLARAVRGERVRDERWRVRCPDGSIILAVGSAHPLLDDEGAQVGAVLTVRDDSAREARARLEVERNTLARQLTEAFMQSPRSTVIYDASGHVIAVNTAFERLWGIGFADVPPDYSVLDDPQLVAAGAMPGLRRAFGVDGTRTSAGAGDATLLPALPYNASDVTGKGHSLWTQAYVYPVRDANGNIERVVLIHEDVTAQREAEAARERTAVLQALTAALSRASDIDDVADAIIAHTAGMLGADGVVVARVTADGQHLELLRSSGMPDDVADAWKQFPVDAPVPLAEAVRSGEALFLGSREVLTARYPVMAAALEATGHHANIVLPISLTDSVQGVLGAAYDAPQVFDEDFRASALTLARLCAQAIERARLFEAEHAARKSAELANRAKSEFLAVMSHELRTPLNAIGGYAELIELGIRGPVTEEQRTDLARIMKSQRHLLGLVNGVLNYSRVEAGAVRYDVEDVPVDEVLATCEALVAPQIRSKRLTLEYVHTDPALIVRADSEKLQQIVLNLLTNAIKFTEPGGGVQLTCVREASEVRIAVTDTGRGIAEDQLTRVFEPFVQVDARLTRTQEGVGLGLAISRDLARGMGGELTAESVVGVGSTFTLVLPLPPST